MARSVNKATIVGNVGQDPEIRTLPNGTKVAQFSVATSRQWTNASNEKQEKTEWHRMVAWSKLAEIAESYVKKGERVYVEGEIQYREYEAKDGSGKRYVTEIHVREMVLLGSGNGGGNASGGGARNTNTAKGGNSAPAADNDSPAWSGAGGGDGEDLPF